MQDDPAVAVLLFTSLNIPAGTAGDQDSAGRLRCLRAPIASLWRDKSTPTHYHPIHGVDLSFFGVLW